MTVIQEQAAAAAPAVKKTYLEKLTEQANTLYTRISADTAKYNDILATISSINTIQNLAQGDAVVVKQGRAETLRHVNGVVLAVKQEESGKNLYRVQIGTGFEADVVTVGAESLSIPAAPATPAEEV